MNDSWRSILVIIGPGVLKQYLRGKSTLQRSGLLGEGSRRVRDGFLHLNPYTIPLLCLCFYVYCFYECAVASCPREIHSSQFYFPSFSFPKIFLSLYKMQIRFQKNEKWKIFLEGCATYRYLCLVYARDSRNWSYVSLPKDVIQSYLGNKKR